MKAIQILMSAVLVVIFSNTAFTQPQTSLIQQIIGVEEPNRALIAVSGRVLLVSVSIDDSEPNKYGLNPADLKSGVVAGLADAGFKILDSQNPFYHELPELRVDIEVLKIESCEQCVITVRTSVAYDVFPPNMEELTYIKADVWKVESGLRSVAVDDVPVEVNAIVQQQVQAFIAACPPMVSAGKQSDVNQPRPQLRKVSIEKGKKPVKQQADESKFVASKNSQVFHKPGCPFAQKIASKNLVTYTSREVAIAAGKRPCKSCNP
jgi:hypothetical protein